ncbi:MAG: DUF421 domain-containing protein [Sporomusaceae bacterium]|nr:DUF421 domain-containing protein [Sporomusaceae bacterium]
MDYDELGVYFLRIVILFTCSLIVVRLMGNRAVGQLSPFDFVIMVGIGDMLTTIAMETNKSVFAGIEGLVSFLLLQQLLARLALKSKRLRKWFEGAPVVLIDKGKIQQANLVKTQFNYDDLRQELHKQGMDFTNLPVIKTARIESCGTFSVIKDPECEPLTKRDLEVYLQNIMENPLSPFGAKWRKFENTLDEVHDFVTKKGAH